MNAQHTPGLWETSSNGKDWDVCIAGGGDMIADLRGCDNAEANAEFIVRACNSHDALLAALELLLKDGASTIRSCDAARAAIKLARGEQ